MKKESHQISIFRFRKGAGLFLHAENEILLFLHTFSIKLWLYFFVKKNTGRVFGAGGSFGIRGFVGSEARGGQLVSSPVGGRNPPGVLGGSRGRIAEQGSESGERCFNSFSSLFVKKRC